MYLLLSSLICCATLAQSPPSKGPDLRFGIVLGKTNGNLVVTGVVGQAAYDAGVRPRQTIEQIAGQPTATMTVEQAIQSMKGPAGAKLELQVIKPGKTLPERIELTRSIYVPLKTVTGTIIDRNVGVVTIRSLELDSGSQVRRALQNFNEQGVKSLIVDLRDNGGGYLQAAADVANLFLDQRCILWITKYSDREQIEHSTPANVWRGPVLIVVNEATASGAELVASSLQCAGRAKVAGRKTMGHAVTRARLGGGAPVVVGVFCNAKRDSLNGKGVQPDVVIDTDSSDDAVISRATLILKSDSNR
jgi:carboxyl-terminal processing protease